MECRMPAIAAADAYCFARVGPGCARLLLPLQPELTVVRGVPVAGRNDHCDARIFLHEAAHRAGLRRHVLRRDHFGHRPRETDLPKRVGRPADVPCVAVVLLLRDSPAGSDWAVCRGVLRRLRHVRCASTRPLGGGTVSVKKC